MQSQRILLTQAEAGMELAAAVVSVKGVALCGPGTVLNEDLIHRLMLLGIKRIVVAGTPLPNTGTRSVVENQVLLDRRFERVIHRPLMRQLKDAARRHLRERL